MIDLLDVSCVCFDPDCCSAGEWLFRAVDDLARAIDVHAVSFDVFPAGLDRQGRFLEAGFSVRPNDVLITWILAFKGLLQKTRSIDLLFVSNGSLVVDAFLRNWLALQGCYSCQMARSPSVLIWIIDRTKIH